MNHLHFRSNTNTNPVPAGGASPLPDPSQKYECGTVGVIVWQTLAVKLQRKNLQISLAQGHPPHNPKNKKTLDGNQVMINSRKM